MRFATREDWREWLAAAHADTPGGVWLEIAKKGSGIESVGTIVPARGRAGGDPHGRGTGRPLAALSDPGETGGGDRYGRRVC